MALKSPRHRVSVSARVSLQEERTWWRRVLDPVIWVVGTLVVVAIISNWQGWPLLGPYKPFIAMSVLKAESEDKVHEAEDAKALIAQIQKQEEAARESLAQELAMLREENLHLKEDLASLRNLKGAIPGADGIKLSSFQVRAGLEPDEYRWRLLVTAPGRDMKPFQGRVLIRLQYPSGDKVDALTHFGNMTDTEGTLTFKYTQTIEGLFKNPQGTKPSQVIAEIWKNGDVAALASISTPLQR